MAYNMNHVLISGNLTRNPESRETKTGKVVTRFTIAFNKSVKRGDTWEDVPQFVQCVAFGKQAEYLVNHLYKGTPVTVDGSLDYQTWESDGVKKSALQIMVNHCNIGARSESDTSYGENIPF